MQDLQTFCAAHFPAGKTTRSKLNNLRTALRHLDAFLERSPTLDDLNRKTITALLDVLASAGRRPETVRRVRTSFVMLSRTAVSAGLIDPLDLPTIDLERRQPFTGPELQRLFGAARTMPGSVSGVPASEWWPALLLLVADARVSAAVAIELAGGAFHLRRGTLDVGPFVRDLHPLTIDALEKVRRPKAPKLLPFDRSLQILYRRMKLLLWRAGLPHVSRNLFDRLRYTGRRTRFALNEIDLQAPFTPRAGRPRIPRARDRRRALLRGLPKPPADGIYRLSINSPRTLRRFFEDVYLPHRLSDATRRTAEDYRKAIDSLSWFLGCDATVDHLSDETIDAFLATLKRTGRYQNVTLNGYRAPLLALWRHAWRKRLTNDQPRDVLKFRVPKRLPEAWTIDEVSRILSAAAQTEGDVGGIPAGQWWLALLLTLYDTGLRINALLRLPVAQVDFKSRWVLVPAELQKHDAEQAFQLHRDTLAAIKATQPDRRTLLFPCPWNHGRLCKRFGEILERAGLPNSNRDKFHKLRRTSGTAVAKAIDLQAAQAHLGHSSASLTKRSYVDPRKLSRQESVSELIERPRWKKGRRR